MDEVDIWLSVVQWITNQIPGLSDNPTNWSPNDVKAQKLPQRKRQLPDIDSVVISKQQASWILQKIAESTQLGDAERSGTSRQTITHKLTLLYRESRDGNINWADKGPTIAVGRVEDTEEILGGYNPLSWSTSEKGYVSTRESFTFSLDKND